MRFQLDPFAPSGVSLEATPKTITKVSQSGSTAMKGADGVGVPTGGATNQVLQKTSGSDYATAWGVSITVASSAPSSPSVNDLWVDTT